MRMVPVREHFKFVIYFIETLFQPDKSTKIIRTKFGPSSNAPKYRNLLRLPPFHFDADPDPAFHFDADPDLAFHFDADADPDPAS